MRASRRAATSADTAATQPVHGLRVLRESHVLARGRLFAGRYVMEAEVGSGAVGRVFRAYDQATKTRIALKVVKTELAGRRSWVERLGREVRHARDVHHPNVCRIFDLGEAEGLTFLTM